MEQYQKNIDLTLGDDGQHVLEIKVATYCVDRYQLDDAGLDSLCDGWQDTTGRGWTSLGTTWFVRNDNVGFPHESVLLRAQPSLDSTHGRDYRVGRQDLVDLCDQVAAAKSQANPQ